MVETLRELATKLQFVVCSKHEGVEEVLSVLMS